MLNPFESLSDQLNRLERKFDLISAVIETHKSVEVSEAKPFDYKSLCERYDWSLATGYSNYSRGKIPGAFKVGRKLFFDRQTILDWEQEHRIKNTKEIQAEAHTYLVGNKKGGAK